MRLLGLILVLLGWVLPVSAAQTFKVPFTVVPGSVTFQGSGDYAPPADAVPATFPISQQVVGNTAGGSCSSGLVTVDADIVDGGLEIEINGQAAGGGCLLGGRITFEAEFQVPEMGGTTTAVRLVPQVLSFDFADYQLIESVISLRPASSSSLPNLGVAVNPVGEVSLVWNRNVSPLGEFVAPDIQTFNWIPGDTLRFGVLVYLNMRGQDDHPAQGNTRTRWEYRVTVPEPSASLSLPLGVAWLAGLAMMRGGA